MIIHRLLIIFCLASSSIGFGMLLEIPSYAQIQAQKPLFSAKSDRTLGRKKRKPLGSITNTSEAEFKETIPAKTQEDPKAKAKREYLAKKEIELKKSIAELEKDFKMLNGQRFFKNVLFEAAKEDFTRMRSQAKDVKTKNEITEKLDALDIGIEQFVETIDSLENHILKAKRRLACRCTKTGEQCYKCDIMNLKNDDDEETVART